MGWVPELVASYWTIAGDCYPGGPETSPFDFRKRIEAAREAGYVGVGLLHADVMAVSARIGFPTMKRIFADNGMKYVELEIITDWYAGSERRERSDKVRADLLNAAEKLGARHIKVCGDLHLGNWPTPHLVDSFRSLCIEAANAGTRIALEPMPFTNIDKFDKGVEIARGAGEVNGGVMIDIWHVARANTPYERLKSMPRDHLAWVEIDDADAKPRGTLWEDTILHRRLCGEGTLDVPSFLRAVKAIGYDGPFGVEIISEILRRRPLAEMAKRSYDTAIKQFDGL